jgi:cell wall-associated NlpC family hydrolase
MNVTVYDPRTALEAVIISLLGKPYRYGGNDTIDGFDCSGLVIELLQSVGVLPPGFDATAEGLRQKFPTLAPGFPPQFGDLVFFGSAAANGEPAKASHVGFCISDRLMLEAGGGDQRTISLHAASDQNAYVRIRPIANRRDRLGFARPGYPA